MSFMQSFVEPFRGCSRHAFHSIKEGVQTRPVFVITPYKKGFAKQCALYLVVKADDSFSVDLNGFLRKDGQLLEITALAVNRKGDIEIQRSINKGVTKGYAGDMFLPILEGKKLVRDVLSNVLEVGVKSSVPIESKLVYYCW